ncbi:TraB/GumN family protein [Lysinibacillus odysseyi]|uniref:Conjugal transfer protein TraB n=1 Tax=Lysinibacillus odysseyi 34hs-1 = NBRC 100172 TaxID=1220589 RepID=A0A0A3ITI7_9BACI|nr:TraB/GumN family protein [Lysinibacillus odysseyi]KGR86188.1 conjugal transfer protein TraB [Lysinibacillus odysseyi 34hs-1 = NBRC 100172]
MKNIWKRTGAILLGASLMLTTVVPAIQAEEQAPLMPSISEWAVGTLNEGEKYGIYPVEWYYDGFLEEIPVEKANELLTLTEKKIAALGLAENKTYKPVKVKNDNTRGDIVKRLYNIAARYDLPVGKDPVKYMQERHILQGSSKGLQLEKKATTQQAVLLAVRFIKDTYALAQQGAKGLAWVVEDEDTTVYLLGSIHVGTPDLYPFDEKLTTAFDESDALVVEANVLDMEGLEYYTEKAMYADGITVKDAVAQETYAKLEQVANLYDLPMEQLELQKPWMLSNTLSLLGMEGSFEIAPEVMAMHGIDNYFLVSALLQEKPVIELEGTKAQVDMFEALSKEAQEQGLVDVLDSILQPSGENEHDMMQEWFASWKQGDAEAFTKSYLAQAADPSEFNQMLFGVRDEKMAKKIVNMLEEKEGTYFVVVGAGHFTVDKNIRYHLEQNGYDVEPFYQ